MYFNQISWKWSNSELLLERCEAGVWSRELISRERGKEEPGRGHRYPRPHFKHRSQETFKFPRAEIVSPGWWNTQGKERPQHTPYSTVRGQQRFPMKIRIRKSHNLSLEKHNLFQSFYRHKKNAIKISVGLFFLNNKIILSSSNIYLEDFTVEIHKEL